jgi:hypothetical protein
MPGLSGTVATLLDDLASARKPGASYVSLTRDDREAIYEQMSKHESAEMRDLASLLGALVIAAVYGEWSGQDADGRVVRRPLGWELTGFRGPRRGVPTLLKD